MTVFTEFKWKMDYFDQRFIERKQEAISPAINLTNDSDSPRAFIQIKDGTIHAAMSPHGIGSGKKFNLVAKGWLEIGDNKFLERVKAFSFGGRCMSVFFIQKWELADWKKFITGKNLNGGSLAICVKIMIGDSVSQFNYEEAKERSEKLSLLQQLALNIGKLLSEGRSDLTIEADDKESKTIETVLMAYSEISKMILFSPNSIEARTGVIKMEDINADVIGALIKWTHTFEVENINEVSEGLFRISHKYQISALMNICVDSMMKSMTVENLPVRTILACAYDVENLKTCIRDFVRKNRLNVQMVVTASKEWLDFDENDDLAEKIATDLWN